MIALHASARKSNRPSWKRAAREEIPRPLFDRFVDRLSDSLGRPVTSGVSGADMQVNLVNDDPVTLDSRNPE